jgi:hypothetical protein
MDPYAHPDNREDGPSNDAPDRSDCESLEVRHDYVGGALCAGDFEHCYTLLSWP